jgi:hypothetical protein
MYIYVCMYIYMYIHISSIARMTPSSPLVALHPVENGVLTRRTHWIEAFRRMTLTVALIH